MTAMMAHKRLVWIDNAKTVAMFCVVFGHINGLFSHAIPGFGIVNNLIVSFNMPLFIFLSGYTSITGLNKITTLKDYSIYIWKVFQRIMIPFIAFLLIESIIYRHFSFSDGPWFLKFLFKTLVCYATVTLFIIKTFRGHNSKVLIYILFIICMFLISERLTPEFAIPFALGALSKELNVFNNIKANKPYFYVILCISIAIFIGGFSISGEYQFYTNGFKEHILKGNFYIFPIRQITAFAAIVVVTSITIICSKSYNIFSKWGSLTLGIYLVHGLIIQIYKSYTLEPLSDCSSAWMWIVAFMASITLWLFSLEIIKMLELNKFTRMLFLGEK